MINIVYKYFTILIRIIIMMGGKKRDVKTKEVYK